MQHYESSKRGCQIRLVESFHVFVIFEQLRFWCRSAYKKYVHYRITFMPILSILTWSTHEVWKKWLSYWNIFVIITFTYVFPILGCFYFFICYFSCHKLSLQSIIIASKSSTTIWQAPNVCLSKVWKTSRCTKVNFRKLVNGIKSCQSITDRQVNNPKNICCI